MIDKQHDEEAPLRIRSAGILPAYGCASGHAHSLRQGFTSQRYAGWKPALRQERLREREYVSMSDLPLAALEAFIVRAKQHTYAGDGHKLLPYRLGSNDLQYAESDWTYHDSYIGESDFIGQEIVYYQGKPVWGMNYFGVILLPDKLTSAQAGEMIKRSLSRLYLEGRFLGAFAYQEGALRYSDQNEGDVRAFRGKEQISRDDEIVYELVYHGGLLRA